MKISNYRSNIVQIGDVALGGNNPVRIQSMTSTNTLDTDATVAQSIRMIDAGCELVRITAPGEREAFALETIKKQLREKGYTTPLVADIHYKPKAAEIAARIVEKVRINPGNYIDRKKGRTGFSESEYKFELEKIHERISPLIKICKEYGTAMRIGSNHGSLSERILLTYGDTPEGMVQSAIEFLEICEDLDYRDIVLSMKASNVRVMVEANRLLVKKMIERGTHYPIHLGVTEAGDAEDGRMKSAAGIGTLLNDGIGDTIRVSLTEDPEFEIPVARSLVLKPNLIREKIKERNQIDQPTLTGEIYNHKTHKAGKLGGGQIPAVVIYTKGITDISFAKDFTPDYFFDTTTGFFQSFSDQHILKPEYITSLKTLQEKGTGLTIDQILVFCLDKVDAIVGVKKWFSFLQENNITHPVLLKFDYGYIETEEMMIRAASDFGYFLVDGLGDGIWLASKVTPPDQLAKIAFGVLQSTRSRITKTDYIACPSCGRTLFNIQDTLQRIKGKTSHLIGLKIGVMGCCVNGPGEMADADYGYVGAGKGKVTLYKGKKIMEAGVKEGEAVDRLIKLIQSNGDLR